ncbi:DUF1045 domain-containing protein [Kiloniella sp. EL199]|uniref:DUF1045 domain-containing protein n=1 Tax=Kiloniella sp. EL199 TaxID=2107581 RepID=UPI0013C4A45D|nr:DUF1045 domain-containing protein [Kiloniella sp. EL199]
MIHERYAIYYAPRFDSKLGQFGNAWFGFNPVSHEDIPRPNVEGMNAQEIENITQGSGRYSFHGTLRSPFKLRKNRNLDSLDKSLKSFVTKVRPIICGPLSIRSIGRFLALVPDDPESQVPDLAEQCMRALDNFRLAPDKQELDRRRQTGLTTIQEQLLLRWGYPFVMEEFRFHLTLSDKLEGMDLIKYQAILEKHCEGLCNEPFVIDEIALFGDPGQGGKFEEISRYKLSAIS